MDCFWVIRNYFCPSSCEFIYDCNRTCLTHIVRFRLKTQTPNCKSFAIKVFAKTCYDFVTHDIFLVIIYRFYRVQNSWVVAKIFCCFCQSLHIFRKTASSIPTTRVNKAVPNTAVASNTVSYSINVRSDTLTNLAHLIHKRYFCR